MKKILKEQKEQTTKVVTAPKDEYDILTKTPLYQGKGTFVNLCHSSNGNPTPVRIGGKLYFAGIKTPKGNYLLYDGRVGKRTSESSCEYSFATKDGKIVQLNGISPQTLQLQYLDVLKQFGINPMDPNVDFYFKLQSITDAFKGLITKGAVSPTFKRWNNLLTYYYPNTFETIKLTPSNTEKTLEIPQNTTILSQKYNLLPNMSKYGINIDGKDIQVYLPKDQAPETFTQSTKRDPEECRVALAKYLGTAFNFEGQSNIDVNQDVLDSKKYLRGCYANGAYDSISLTSADMEPYLDVANEDNPFGTGFLGNLSKMGKTLSIDNIKKLLSGKSKFLPAGSNPYVPFYLRPKDAMNESSVNLKKIIKENLNEMANHKQTLLKEERNIINNRVKMLVEGRVIKTQSHLKQLSKEIFSEALYLNQQGFNKELINENFWDTLKGMFGGVGFDSIGQYFKEQVAKYIISKIAPGEENGWIAGIIEKLIGNTPISEIPKLLNCDYLVPKLAESIVEEVLDKAKNSMGLSGAISDIIRNGIVSSLNKTELAQSLEKSLTAVVCPALSSVSNKLMGVGDNMKSKALAA
jgi:hypothetical protein